MTAIPATNHGVHAPRRAEAATAMLAGMATPRNSSITGATIASKPMPQAEMPWSCQRCGRHQPATAARISQLAINPIS